MNGINWIRMEHERRAEEMKKKRAGKPKEQLDSSANVNQIPTFEQEYREAKKEGIDIIEYKEQQEKKARQGKLERELALRKKFTEKIKDLSLGCTEKDLQVIVNIIIKYRQGGLKSVVAYANEMIAQTEEEQK